MSMNDLLSDMVARVRNGQNARLASVSCLYSGLCADSLKVLEGEGYIRGFEVVDLGSNKKELQVALKYYDGEPAIKEIKRISKPGCRVSSGIKELKKVYNGLGVAVLSTSKGVISDYEARLQNAGGEVLFTVF